MSEFAPKRILVTGGAGFIGSNFVHYVLNNKPGVEVMVLDCLTYAGNKENLQMAFENPLFSFVKGDIRNAGLVDSLMEKVDSVVHLAAESHVDRSIADAQNFISTNVDGTYVLLEAVKKRKIKRFLNVSTDEVYGSLQEGYADENFSLRPSSPYSASKAAQDLLAQAYCTTYDLPVITTRSCNNFGPYQYPEKIIPLFITNAMDNVPLPLYGKGLNVREWLFVEDHCKALYTVLCKGTVGEIYNIGSGNASTNVALTAKILTALNKPETLIKRVQDRLGHDFRYALNFDKVKKLGWKPQHNFDQALASTIAWYATHEPWWRKLTIVKS